jgi:hypothetical protein
MRRPLVSLTVVALSALSSLAWAQAGGGATPQMSYEAVTSAPEGSWAEYLTTLKGRPEKVKVRYALVEKSAKKLALEIDTNTPPLGAVLIRMDYEPVSPTEWKLAHARMSVNGAAPQEMPVPATTPNLKKGDTGTPVGKATIKTPVGTFETKQFRTTVPQGTFDIFMSDKAFPVGLVKQSDQAGNVETLISATGTGAKSKMPATAAAPK